ncbi:OmpP1/FadL family transporter [Brucella pseudogrignonensis]|uniref:Long-chain fatty acid transport protein n=1 Tax=Brucella pseudogrignonensis TaxID=419475 RepID=A0ABU1M5A6_9HYPH|nr:OmpP1/FadL family transporter [Brucella pseudogrignonensis]MDR6431088.1 long-chain fatty acid transport protein [Brucella pseudogrignonensis]
MKVKSLKVAGIATALLGSAVSAHAGGFERSSQDFDILFEQGTVIDTTGTFVSPQRKLKNIRGSAVGTLPAPYGTGGINPVTNQPYSTEVDEAKGYWVPKFSAKVDLTDDLACSAQYRQPWGIHTDVGTDTVRMYTAIEQKISSNDYGLNCSYRFSAGEKGFFRILGGVSYQELKGEQTRMIPGISPLNNPTNFPFPGERRIASLDVEDKAVGWRLGAAYELPEYAIRASLVYQSEVKYNLSGSIDNLAVNPFTNQAISIPVESDVATPQSVELKLQTGIAPDWLAFGSIKWTDWSSIERVSFNASTNVQVVPGRVVPKGANITNLNMYYQDGWTVSGGIGHKFNEQWSAAGTVTWDRGTTTGLTSQTDIWLFGLGTNYKATDNFEVRLAGAAGWLTSGEMDDTVINGVANPSGSKGDFGNDFIGALSLTAKVKF